MFHLIHRPLTALAVLGALAVAVPAAQAQTASPATPPAVTKTKAAATKTAPTDRVEERITDLHAKLKITADEEPKWTQVVAVMRDNAKKMDDLLRTRNDGIRSMTAVDDLRSYRDITQAHADGLQKLISAFEDLYGTMTPDQKKNADVVFAKFQAPQRAASAGKTAKGS